MLIYTRGDATNPIDIIDCNTKVIVHCCNDAGVWGKGFVLALSKKWSQPEKKYREWAKSKNNFSLGEIQLVTVSENIVVANLIGQHRYGSSQSKYYPFIRYSALETGFEKLALHFSKDLDVSFHMPRIGCGLAGGQWNKVSPLIEKKLANYKVVVYDFDSN